MLTTLTPPVLEKYPNPIFFETGTSGGHAIDLALKYDCFKKLISIEIEPQIQDENRNRLKSYIDSGRLNLVTGDSLQCLQNYIPLLDQPTTFWLDAHVDFGIAGVKKCPLYEELEAIATSDIKSHTILIDDLRIFGGGTWGSGINLDVIKQKILDINPNYTILTEPGVQDDDILVAIV